MKEYAVPESWTAIVILDSSRVKSHGLLLNPDGRILCFKYFLIAFDTEENKCYRIEVYVANSKLFQPAKEYLHCRGELTVTKGQN